MARVPFFVRKRVKNRVEEEARARGADEVRLEHVRACQQRFLNRMEDEVQGYRVETCFGSGGCPNRAVQEDALVGRLEKILAGADLLGFLRSRVQGPLKMHHELRVSMSDCPNACSRPQIADIGLIGAARPGVAVEAACSGCRACVEVCREGAVKLDENAPAPTIDPELCLACGQCVSACPTGTLIEASRGFRIQIGGRLGRHPRLATELPGLHSAEEVVVFLDGVLAFYRRYNQSGERLGEMISREGLEELLKSAGMTALPENNS